MSPIYSVQERGEKLPQLGTIRKGIKKPVVKDGKPKLQADGNPIMYPAEVEYLVVHPTPTLLDGVKKVFKEVYGDEKPKSIEVFLAFSDANKNWDYWLEAYNFNQRISYSDEKTVLYLFDTDTNQILVKDGAVVNHSNNPNSMAGKLVKDLSIGSVLPYAPDMLVSESKSSGAGIKFKAVGRLKIIIPHLHTIGGMPFGYFTVLTGDQYVDIPVITTIINKVNEISKATGRPANTIPLTLMRLPFERSYRADDGSKKRKTAYSMELAIRPALVAQLLKSYADTPLEFSLRRTPILPASVDVIDEEAYDELEDTTDGDAGFINSDPIPDEKWNAWVELVTAADLLGIKHASPNREMTTLENLRVEYNRISGEVADKRKSSSATKSNSTSASRALPR
jgi:hypothetical protein